MGKILYFVFEQHKRTKATTSGCRHTEHRWVLFFVSSSTDCIPWWEGELLNGKTVIICIWSMIFGGFKPDDLSLKAVLISVGVEFGDQWLGVGFSFSSLSWAILHGKVLVFNRHTPKLQLTRVIWEPPTWAVRSLVKEHNWSAFLATCLGNLWWIKAAVTYSLSLLVEKDLACRSKGLAVCLHNA